MRLGKIPAVALFFPLLAITLVSGCGEPWGPGSGLAVQKIEDWIYNGHLYEFYYGTDEQGADKVEVYAVGPDGVKKEVSPEFGMEVRAVAERTRAARQAASQGSSEALPQEARLTGGLVSLAQDFLHSIFPQVWPDTTAAPAAAGPQPSVTHILDWRNAYVWRFDPVTKKISVSLHAVCAGDVVQYAAGFDISHDNKVGVIVQNDGTNNCAVIFDPQSYTVKKTVKLDSTQRLHAVAITPDNRFAYIDTDKNGAPSIIYVVDLQAGTVVNSITLDLWYVDTMAMTPDGAQIYLSNSGVELRVIDTATNTVSALPVKTSDGYSYQTDYMLVHPNGTKLYLFSWRRNSMLVMDTASGQVVKELTPFADARTPSLATRGDPQFTPDGRYLFVVLGSTEVTMVDTVTDTVSQRIPIHTNTNFGDRTVGYFYVPGQ